MLRIHDAAGAFVLAACSFLQPARAMAQAAVAEQARVAAPLAFAVVSEKPAPPEAFVAPAFMRDRGARIVGVQTMAAPVYMTVGYAYHMQISEAKEAFKKQPDWTKKKIYMETFRVDGEPTREQVREMMRSMLADRFGLQVHEFTRDGVVNRLVLNKPGVLGPNLKPHPDGASCTSQQSSAAAGVPDGSALPVGHCGFSLTVLPGNVRRVEITDTTIADAGKALASFGGNGMEMHPVLDAIGLSGKYDVTLEFRSTDLGLSADPAKDESEAPTLVEAMKDQLGLRVESGQGPVRMVVIDHIAQPEPD